MSKNFKPEHYNSLSPYLIVDDAQKLADMLKTVFDATELRRYDDGNGKIAHMEMMLDDTVIMIADSTPKWPATKSILHVYVPDVLTTFGRALEYGCEELEKPVNKPGDPDTRGSFYDFAGNHWAVGTQNS